MLAQRSCTKPDHLLLAVDNLRPLTFDCTDDNQMDRIRSYVDSCEFHALSAFKVVFNNLWFYLLPSFIVTCLILKSNQPRSLVFLQRPRSISSAFNRAWSAFLLFGSDAKAISVR